MKKKKIQYKEKKLLAKDYTCFLAAVKEAAEKGDVRFVVVRSDGTEVPVEIVYGRPIKLAGKDKTDAEVRDFLYNNHAEFERLFLEAYKEHDPELHIMASLYLAKLTDVAGRYGKKAKVKVYDGSQEHTFVTERLGEGGRYTLDGEILSKSAAEAYIEKHYSEFLVGLKAAKKEMRKSVYEGTQFRNSYTSAKQKTPQSQIVDGKLQVDIESFLAPKKATTPTPQSHDMAKGLSYLTPPKRGYIDKNKKD